ncbi:MAG: hypothetical protein ABR969_00230 [Sedimentisphaerales bacterium]|jgi:hypothetical protein
MKWEKILRKIGIFLGLICVIVAILFFLLILWSAHIFKKEYLIQYNPAIIREGKWEQQAPEASNFAKWITIDEIPPAMNIRAIFLFNNYYFFGCKSCRDSKIIDMNAIEKFDVIGDANEVKMLIGRNVPANWVIGDSNYVKKITNDFISSTRCKNIVPKFFDGVLSTLLAYIPIGNHFEISVAWDFYKGINQGSPIKKMYSGFPADGYAIFIADSKIYALKYGIDERTIYGPDYYSKKLYKDLKMLYNKKNQSFESGERKGMGER